MSSAVQDGRSHGDSNWAAFDDLAAQRSSSHESSESARNFESQSNQSHQASTSAQPSQAEGGWAAFASDSSAFQPDDAAFQEDPAAFPTAPAGSHVSRDFDPKEHVSSAQTWAAFNEPEASQNHSSTDEPQTHRVAPSGELLQSDEKPLPQAEFGESNYWRTHPLALVDSVD